MQNKLLIKIISNGARNSMHWELLYKIKPIKFSLKQYNITLYLNHCDSLDPI